MTHQSRITILTSMRDISSERWSSLTGAGKTGLSAYHPFLSHAFLSALEESGSATAKTGWMGHHLLLEAEDGTLLGAVPGYLKNHSQGEYVFDHGWADAFERAGGRYYPKIQCAIPFTPATGPRLLVTNEADGTEIRATLAAALKGNVDQLGVSSAHVTFLPGEEIPVFETAGFLLRKDQSFHQ
jgi:uncharacterized protein